MRLKTMLGISFIFLSLILSACSQKEKEYEFRGESDNWIATYDTKMSEERGWAEISIEYVGKEPAPATFGYRVKGSWFESGSDKEEFNQKGKNILTGNSECTGPPLNDKSCLVDIGKDEQIKVKMEWEGNSEKIILNRR